MRNLKLSFTVRLDNDADPAGVLDTLTDFQDSFEYDYSGYRCSIVEEATVEELKEDTSRGPALEAWAIKHDSHGMYMDEVVFMPAGEKPESNKCWVRLPWLDGKGYDYR